MVTSELIKQKRQHAGLKTITNEEITEIQSYYDNGHSLRECQARYGYCRTTLIKYLHTRPIQKRFTQDELKRNKVNSVIGWRIRTKQKLVEYKGGKCVSCGYNKYIGALGFHHLDPNQKDFQISGKSISFDKLKAESDKCILLCHNCHAELHAGLITL